jgi:hypothetical protein
MSPTNGIFRGPCGPIEKCHVAPPGDATWHHPGSTTCQYRVTGKQHQHTGGLSVGATWPNHRATRGIPKCPILTRERIFVLKKMAGPPNLADHANFSSQLEVSSSGSLKLAGEIYCNIYIYINIYITNTPKWSPVGFDPGTSALPNAFNNSAHNQCATGVAWYIRPHLLFKRCNPPRARGRGTDRTTCGHGFRDKTVIIAGCRGHKNRDKILLGPGSARVGSEHGDSHFWVIRRHESSGDVCFLI